MSELRELDPFLFNFVSISYEGYQLKMLNWPKNRVSPFQLQHAREAAQAAKSNCQISEYLSKGQTKVINKMDLESLLKHKGQVQQYTAHIYRLIIEFHRAVFVLEHTVVYHIKERFEEYNKERKGTTTE